MAFSTTIVKLVSRGLAGILFATSIAPAFSFVERREQPGARAPRVATNYTPFAGALKHSATATPCEFGEMPATWIPSGGSLLNEVGRIAYPVSKANIADWKGSKRPLDKLRYAEVVLWQRRAPIVAEAMFSELIRSSADTEVINLAKRGKAFALHFQGRYREAETYLTMVLNTDTRYLDSRALAGFLGHIKMCAGFHARNEKAGVFQPWRLDPLCGVRSVAKSLERFGVAYDEKKAAKAVRYDGFGSTMADIEAGIRNLGYDAHVFNGDLDIVKDLPLPVVVHVEHDHFVTVVKADDKHVTIWCVDCGGERQLTWKQWELMEPDAYAVPMLKDSSESAFFKATLEGESNLIASLGSFVSPFASMKGRIQPILVLGLLALICGNRPQGIPCDDCVAGQDCPEVTTEHTDKPVNIATGGEEYKPEPDLTVYNPCGPSVSWAREYFSLGNPVANGFGTNWTHNYNWSVSAYLGPDAPSTPDPPSPFDYKADIVMPSSGHYVFDLPVTAQKPSVSSPVDVKMVPEQSQVPVILWWRWNSTTQKDYFEIQFQNQTVMRMAEAQAYPHLQEQPRPYVNNGALHRLERITDINGLYITFHYESFTRGIELSGGQGNPNTTSSYPVTILTQIKDSAGSPLLSMSVTTDGVYDFVTDRYNRRVDYSISREDSLYIQAGVAAQIYVVDSASLIYESTGSPIVKHEYTYEPVANGHAAVHPNPYGQMVPSIKQIKVKSPTGTGMSTAELFYDSMGFIDKVKDANGNTIEIDQGTTAEAEITHRDASNNVVERYTVGWNGMGSVQYYKDAGGNVVHNRVYASNTFFKPSRVDDADGNQWHFEWDAFGNLEQVTTPRNITTTRTIEYTNNPLGRVTKVQEGSKCSTEIFYDTTGRVSEVHSPVPGNVGGTTRQVTNYEYGSLGNLIEIESPGNNSETRHNVYLDYGTSPKVGLPLAVTNNSSGETTQFTYDSRGNTLTSTDALGNTSTVEYNLADQVVKAWAPPAVASGPQTRVETSYIYLGGPVYQTKAYDTSNNLIRTATTVYGAEGEVLSTTGDTEPSYVTYTPTYRVKTVRDGFNNSTHQTTYTYNTDGECTQVDLPEASGTNYGRLMFTYNGNGQVLTRTDGRGIVTTYAYSATDSALDGWTYSNGGSVSLTRDSYGRVTDVTDASGSASSIYDDLGNLTEATRTYTGLAAKTFKYWYFPDGSRQKMENPAGTWEYLYDKSGRYTSMTSPLGMVSSEYELNGWQKKRTLPNGAYTTYGYNGLGLPTSLVSKKSDGTDIGTWGSFTYDGVQNLVGTTSSLHPGGSNFNGTISYTVDTKERLTQETSSRFGGYTENNVWDAASNPTTYRNSANRTYNGSNQRTSGTSFEYDGNGNPTKYNNTAATFDNENRMTAYTNGYQNTFGYRADGLRAWKQYVSGGQPKKRYYLYDGGNPVVELDTSGNVVATNVYAPDGLVGRTWEASSQTHNRYYLFDWQGNLAVTMGDATTVRSGWAFNAWGQVNSINPYTADSFWDDCFGYNARWGYIKETSIGGTYAGMYYCQNRYYDPANGRWLNRDPIGYAGGMNLYGYCGGGPVGAADSDGAQAKLVLVAAYAADPELGDLNHGLSRKFSKSRWGRNPGYYYYRRPNGAIVIHWPDQDDPAELNREWLIGYYCGTGKKASTLIREWEAIHGKKWPKRADGTNYIADHIVPKADGGEDHGRNIQPQESQKAHNDRHREDYRRWALRRWRGKNQ